MIMSNTFEYDNGSDTFVLDFNKTKSMLEDIAGNYETQIINLHNEYCEDNGDSDNMIYSMDEFDDVVNMNDYTPKDFLYQFSSLNLNDKYFTFEDNESFKSVVSDKSPIDYGALLTYLVENDRLEELENDFGLDLTDESLQYKQSNSYNYHP